MPENTHQNKQSKNNTPKKPKASLQNDKQRPGRIGLRKPKPGRYETRAGSSIPVDDGETSSYSDVPLDSDGESGSSTGSWDLVEEAYPIFHCIGAIAELPAKEASVQRSSQTRNSSNASSGHGPDTQSTQETLQFDDDNLEYLSSDSELDWGSQPFDYEVPFGPMEEERYSFEVTPLRGGSGCSSKPT